MTEASLEYAKLEIVWTIPLNIQQMEKHPVMRSGGLYFWVQNNRIIYVGEAQCFHDRYFQHLLCMVGGSYTVWDFKEGEDPYVFMKATGKGLTPENPKLLWGNFDSLLSIVDPNRIGKYLEALKRMTFMFGTCEPAFSDKIIRQEIEGGIIHQLCDCHELFRSKTTVLGNINRYPTRDYRLEHKGDGADRVKELLDGAVDAVRRAS